MQPVKLFFVTLLLTGCASPRLSSGPDALVEFRAELERLRASGHIESLSAVISRGESIVWSAALGNPAVGDTTAFYLASLTKPIAATIVMQLVDEGKVSLDDPVSNYGIVIDGTDTVRVRHLLNHTSEGVPGSRYNYNGSRFSLLDSVIRRAAGMSFAAATRERILMRLGLRHLAPTPFAAAFGEGGLDRMVFLDNLVQGYVWTDGALTRTAYRTSFSPAAGLVASARDYAAFSMALDRDVFLRPATRELSWTPTVGPDGQRFPYGLGWFTTDYKGVPLVWHYGWWTAASALVIKVPSQQLTFVLLANTEGLSAPYGLGGGDLLKSPWARAFLERFVRVP
jgi:CubicO group peptidase (beta-lactamase class C family)